MVDGRRPLLPEISGQLAPVGAKSPILNRCSLIAPQRGSKTQNGSFGVKSHFD